MPRLPWCQASSGLQRVWPSGQTRLAAALGLGLMYPCAAEPWAWSWQKGVRQLGNNWRVLAHGMKSAGHLLLAVVWCGLPHLCKPGQDGRQHGLGRTQSQSLLPPCSFTIPSVNVQSDVRRGEERRLSSSLTPLPRGHRVLRSPGPSPLHSSPHQALPPPLGLPCPLLCPSGRPVLFYQLGLLRLTLLDLPSKGMARSGLVIPG